MIDRRRLCSTLPSGLMLTLAPRAFAQGKPVVIPFAMPHDEPYMFVGINGKGPYRFLMDTGNAGLTGVKFPLVRELKLPDTNSEQSIGVVGEGESGHYAVEEMNVGGVLRQRHVGVAGLFENQQGGFGALDGILPAKFFLTHDTEIDFTAKQVRIYAEGRPDRTGFTALSYLSDSDRADTIVVQARFNGIACRLQIDTGCAGALTLSQGFVARNRLWDAFPKHIDGSAQGVTGMAVQRTVKAASFSLGAYTFREVIVDLIDPQAESHMQIDGLVGIDILRRFTLSFAPDERVLYLKPNSAISDPYAYDRGGLSVAFDRERKEGVVTGLDDDGSAKRSGLQIGDRLPEVTSIAVLRELQWRMRGFPGDTLPLSVSRPGGVQTVTVTLQDRL